MSEIKKKTTRVSLNISSPVNETSNIRSSYSTLVQPLLIDPHRMQSPCSSSLSGSTCAVAPVFTKHLQDISTTRGQFVVFECRVQATATVQVHWYREKEQIADSDDFRILRKKACLSSIPEEVCTLIITEAFPEDSGQFKCIAENEAGTAVSTARLFVSPEGRDLEKSERSPKSPMRKFSPKLASFPWSSDSYIKEKNSDNTPINLMPTIPETGSHTEHEVQVPKKDFCTTNENSSELQPQCYQQPSVGQPVNAKPSQSLNAKPIPRTPDHEIQGSKEALIQDLERKLKCKDSLLHNGNQRLTYEEKMARRLLGPQNAAAVFQAQNDSAAQDSPQQHNSEHARLQVPTSQVRSRSSSRGDVNDQDAIQEKFYPPRFIQVPENMSIEEGRFCRMDFKVSGLTAPDVSWYLNGRPVQSDDLHKMIVSEKGFHSLIFEVVRASDAGAYACVAKNRAGEATFTVQLDVLAKEHRRAPMFIYKPQSKKVFEGDSVKLECQISAIPPPKLFWKRNNEMVQFNTDRISLYHDNSGRVTLLIKDVNKKDAGWYTVSAVNEAGVITCNTRLDVTARPNQTLPAPKQLRVRPTFSKYLALNGRGLDVKQAFNPEGEFQRLAAQSGLYESEEL
uniref:Myotilin n=1 Tax=Sus scrofa TaxID=9823 RepID=A0A8D1II31_PIG